MHRLIDADALNEVLFDRVLKFANVNGSLGGAVAGVIGIVKEMPTIDAVEVVRCKVCKHHHWEQEPCHGKTVHHCNVLDAEVWRDFFCAYGERRGEDA